MGQAGILNGEATPGVLLSLSARIFPRAISDARASFQLDGIHIFVMSDPCCGERTAVNFPIWLEPARWPVRSRPE